ncbi:hypothetical protein [Streptococcus pneumoniae]|uniref:hypothetical protein n=1 Tax=Streptococcus pneumoniae TaxID=1313 RepID=UPI00070B542D|nr:hypothetical protein [Streptococcus pneumoniae]
MKIKEQTRKLAQATQSTALKLQIKLTRFEEIFEEYKNPQDTFFYPLVYKENTYEKNCYFYLCSPNVRSLLPVPIQPAKL